MSQFPHDLSFSFSIAAAPPSCKMATQCATTTVATWTRWRLAPGSGWCARPVATSTTTSTVWTRAWPAQDCRQVLWSCCCCCLHRPTPKVDMVFCVPQKCLLWSTCTASVSRCPSPPRQARWTTASAPATSPRRASPSSHQVGMLTWLITTIVLFRALLYFTASPAGHIKL